MHGDARSPGEQVTEEQLQTLLIAGRALGPSYDAGLIQEHLTRIRRSAASGQGAMQCVRAVVRLLVHPALVPSYVLSVNLLLASQLVAVYPLTHGDYSGAVIGIGPAALFVPEDTSRLGGCLPALLTCNGAFLAALAALLVLVWSAGPRAWHALSWLRASTCASILALVGIALLDGLAEAGFAGTGSVICLQIVALKLALLAALVWLIAAVGKMASSAFSA